MGLINGAEQDPVRKVNDVCELMMRQLFLSHNLKKVGSLNAKLYSRGLVKSNHSVTNSATDNRFMVKFVF